MVESRAHLGAFGQLCNGLGKLAVFGAVHTRNYAKLYRLINDRGFGFRTWREYAEQWRATSTGNYRYLTSASIQIRRVKPSHLIRPTAAFSPSDAEKECCAVLFRLFKKRRGQGAAHAKSIGFGTFKAAGTRVALRGKN